MRINELINELSETYLAKLRKIALSFRTLIWRLLSKSLEEGIDDSIPFSCGLIALLDLDPQQPRPVKGPDPETEHSHAPMN